MTKRDELIGLLRFCFGSFLNERHYETLANEIEAIFRPSFSETVQKQEKKERIINRESEGLKAVLRVMSDGQWRTDEEIHQLSGVTQHAVSARRSDLRKLGYNVERHKPEGRKCYVYRLTSDKPIHQPAPPVVS